ncbi:MAG: phosphotransferase [Succinivibrio sp.]|nr:phosphotransferase [Succinivibrio sp.]
MSELNVNNINNGQNNYVNNDQNNPDDEKVSILAEINGLNTAHEDLDVLDDNGPDEIINDFEVIDEITDVPELSDALVSKNKALKIFKSPLETHDSFERTLKRKHKFNFFEKVLCVVTFGLASKLINHLNKSNDHREAMELKNNTLAINQTLAHMSKGNEKERVGIDLYDGGKAIHCILERDEKAQLFIKLPGVAHKIKLPYDLDHMKTLIATDICSHIDIFGLDSALIGLDSQDKDINRRGMLTNILSHMTGGEKKYHELSVMDFNSLESIVSQIRDNSDNLRQSGQSDEQIQQSNKTYLDNQLQLIEQRHLLLNSKINSSVRNKSSVYENSIKEIQLRLHESELEKLNLERKPLKEHSDFLTKTISEQENSIKDLEAKKDLNAEDLMNLKNLKVWLNENKEKLDSVSKQLLDLDLQIRDKQVALDEEKEEFAKPKEPEQVAEEGDNVPQNQDEILKHSPKINSLYVDSIIDKLEAEKKKSPQGIDDKLNTSVIQKGTDNKYTQKIADLQQKISLVKEANKDVIEKYDNDLKTLKGKSENELKNFYAADALGSKIINLNNEFTKNRALKTSYDEKVASLKSEIDKLKQSQDPVAQENLKTLTTELNTLTSNPSYLTDAQIMKNFVLENKELFASLNAEIAKLKKENNSYDDMQAFMNTAIGKLLNKEIADVVYQICREIGFDKQTSDSVYRAVTAHEAQSNIIDGFNFFLKKLGKSISEKQDVLGVSFARIAGDISNLSVVKAQNLVTELSIALDGKKLNYQSFQELKKKYITIMYNFESGAKKNSINKQVPNYLLNLLKGLTKAKNSDEFDRVLDSYGKAQNMMVTVKQIQDDVKVGLNANDALKMIFADDNDPNSIDENKPVFNLFTDLVKNPDKNAIYAAINALKPYMAEESFSVLEGVAGIFVSFVLSPHVKAELAKDPNTDLGALFKKMMGDALKGNFVSIITLMEKKIESTPITETEELKNQLYEYRSDNWNSSKDRLCVKVNALFSRIENINIAKGFERLEQLSSSGKLTAEALKAELANNPSILIAVATKSLPDNLTPQQRYLVAHLNLAFSPLISVLTKSFTDGKPTSRLEDDDFRELVSKLILSHSYDPITLGENKYNPITDDIRGVYSTAITTAVSIIPKVVTSLDTGRVKIGSATLSDEGAADYHMALGDLNRIIEEVNNDENLYSGRVNNINLGFEANQKQLLQEQRAFWVHNFLADLILEEDGNQIDKEIDKLNSDEGKVVEPGAKLQRLMMKHAKALAYMIKDPQALNTLPSMIKTKVADLIGQIKESGMDFLGGEGDTFTDVQLENSAALIRNFLDFDVKKGVGELTDAQLEVKLSLIKAEKDLDESVDSILDEVSNMIVEPELEEGAADNEANVQAQQPVQNNVEAVGDEEPDEDLDDENAPKVVRKNVDPLDPNSTLQDLEAASGNTENVMTQFVTNVRKTYFTKLSKLDKLSMVAAAIRYSRAEIDGKLSTDKMIGAAFKGAGPIMQKLLQKTPQNEISETLKQSFSDMKSNLAPIPENVVQAHLLEVINNSDGKIKKIDIQRSLGAASVGEAFLCKVYTADKPEGVDCVIKILRPDVMNKALREMEIFREAAKKIPGMDVTFEGSLKTIMEELDLTIEAQNVVSGQIYSNFDSKVQSMKLFDLVPPSTDVLIIEKAPGVTVNNVVTSMEDNLLHNILKPVNTMGHEIPGIDPVPSYTSVNEFINGYTSISIPEETSQDIQKKLLDEYEALIEQRNNLVKFSKEWVTQGIFDTGFYHGDLHAGNIMTSKDKLTVIDFGNCVKLTALQQENIIRMMAASLDKNGPVFMQGLKSLLSEKSLERLANVKEGQDKTVEQYLTEVISAILKKGSEEDTGLKIKLVMEAILKEGIEIPAPIYNFEVCQLSIQNTIEEMNQQISTINDMFLAFGQGANADHHFNLCPSMGFAQKASETFKDVTNFKEASKALLKLYNEELDKLQNDPDDELKKKIKHIAKQATSSNIDEELNEHAKAAFTFNDDDHFRELYSNWQTLRMANAKKGDENEEPTVQEIKAEDDAFEAFFAYYKEKQTVMMQKEYEHLKRFLELRNKPDESFLTGMAEVLQTYKWDAMGTLGTLNSIKFAVKSLFA